MLGYSVPPHSPSDMEGRLSWFGLQCKESYNLLFGSYNLPVPVVTGISVVGKNTVECIVKKLN